MTLTAAPQPSNKVIQCVKEYFRRHHHIKNKLYKAELVISWCVIDFAQAALLHFNF